MLPSSLAKQGPRVLFIITLVLYFFGLGWLPLAGRDEPRYCEVAREMFVRGDPVTPTLGGHAWFEKPALLYWLLMSSFRIFGVTEWAARLVPACAGVATALLTCWLADSVQRSAQRPEEGASGPWSGLAVATSAGMIAFSRAATFDSILTATVTAALACFFLSTIETRQSRRAWLLAGFYAATGLSLLAKGLVGIVLPFCIAGAYFLFRRAAPERKVLRSLVWGLPLTLLVASTWYGPVIARHGWTFIDEFFVQQHFARYLSNKYHHPEPWYFYPPVLLALATPWSLFLIAALARLRRRQWRAREATVQLQVFSFAWLVVPVLFFSFSSSKLPGYVLPALPGAMLLATPELSRLWRNDCRVLALRLTGGLLLATSAGLAFYVTRENLSDSFIAITVVSPLAVAGIYTLSGSDARGNRRRLLAIVVAILVSMLLAATLVLKEAGRKASVRDLLALSASRGFRDAPVYELHDIERTAEFYASGRLLYDEHGEPRKFEGTTEIWNAMAASGAESALVLVPREYAAQVTGDERFDSEVMGDNGQYALVGVRRRQG